MSVRSLQDYFKSTWQAINSCDSTLENSEPFWFSIHMSIHKSLWVCSHYKTLVDRKSIKFFQMLELNNTNENSHEKGVQILHKDLHLNPSGSINNILSICTNTNISVEKEFQLVNVIILHWIILSPDSSYYGTHHNLILSAVEYNKLIQLALLQVFNCIQFFEWRNIIKNLNNNTSCERQESQK